MSDSMNKLLVGIGITIILVSAIYLAIPDIHIIDNQVTFTVDAPYILVDEYSDFSSPVRIYHPFTIKLEPGVYYWKTPSSKIKSFEILSVIQVKQHKSGDQYLIENTGNTPVIASGITGAAIMEVGDITIQEGELEVREHG